MPRPAPRPLPACLSRFSSRHWTDESSGAEDIGPLATVSMTMALSSPFSTCAEEPFSPSPASRRPSDRGLTWRLKGRHMWSILPLPNWRRSPAVILVRLPEKAAPLRLPPPGRAMMAEDGGSMWQARAFHSGCSGCRLAHQCTCPPCLVAARWH